MSKDTKQGAQPMRGTRIASGAIWAKTCLLATILLTAGCGGGGGGTESLQAQQPGSSPGTTSGVMVLWDPPIDSNGSSVSDLAGYNVYYSMTTPITMSTSALVTVDSNATSVALPSLPPGTYYVAVSAVYRTGDESAQTDEVMATVQ